MTLRRLSLGDGLVVACHDSGPLSRAGKKAAPPPLVLLHGIGADRREWLLAWPFLVGRRRLLSFDLLGHGGSTIPAGEGVDVRLRLLSTAVVEALDLLPDPPRRIDLLGHSLGGAVALDLVRRFPRLVRRLVLVSAAGLDLALSLTHDAMSLPFAPRDFAERRRLLRTSVNHPLLRSNLVALGVAAYKGRRKNRAALLKLIGSIAAGEGLVTPRDLQRVSQPTLVLWGDGDRIFPVASGRRLARLVPNARLEILPRCGHVPPTERPLAFARRVNAFLDEE